MSTPLLAFIGIQCTSAIVAAMLLHSYRNIHRERMEMLRAIGCHARASRQRGFVLVSMAYIVCTVMIAVLSASFFLPSA